MAADEFRRGVGDDIRAPFEWPAKIGCCKCVVDHQWDVKFLRDLRHFFEWKDIHQWVADGLAINDLCIWLDRAAEIFGVRWVNKGHADPQTRECVFELADCPAI